MGRSELSNRIERWRGLQVALMSSLTPLHLTRNLCKIEGELLFLPSHFSSQDRVILSLELLATEEALLRSANASECILQLRQVTRIISGMHYIRRTDIRGQKEGTRSKSSIQSASFDRDHLLELYDVTRNALRSLNSDIGRFPPLTQDDLYLKPVDDRRQLNDTWRSDGPI